MLISLYISRMEITNEKYVGKWYKLNTSDEKTRIMSSYVKSDGSISLILGSSVSIPNEKNGINEISISFLKEHFIPIDPI